MSLNRFQIWWDLRISVAYRIAPWKLQLHYYYKFLQWMKMLHACISIAVHILEKLLRVKGWGESCMPRCTLRRRPQMRWSIWLTQPVISVGGVGTLLCHISQLSENTNRWSDSTCHLVNCPTRQSLLLFIGSLHWLSSWQWWHPHKWSHHPVLDFHTQITRKYSTAMCY